MNEIANTIKRKHIDAAVEALRKNRFKAEYVASPEELIETLSSMIPAGSSCSLGGSVTLMETGVQSWLEQRKDITYYDRYAPDADQVKVFRQALSCDYYISGTNAITLDGQLYNIDGRGNRVAALSFGPDKVILVCGYNKLVPDLEAARARVKMMAAPANAARLDRGTPCVVSGRCHECASGKRICSQELTTGWQAIPERICVLIMGGSYGF